MPKEKDISTNAKLFLEEYVKNGFHASKAYATIFPNANERTCNTNAHKLLKDERCKKYLREYIDSLNEDRATPEAVISAICDIAFCMDNPPDLRLKALTQLSKILSLEQLNVNANVKADVNVNPYANLTEEELKKLAEIEDDEGEQDS